MSKSISTSKTLGPLSEELAEIFRTLRSPQGCAWNRAQTFSTLKTFWLEESSEALEALANVSTSPTPENREKLREELGDMLLQITFISTLAEEENSFSLASVVEGLNEKLRRRHPHVFGSEKATSPEAVARLWERVKQEEKAGKSKPAASGALSGVPVSMPALARAQNVSAKAAALGFDWPEVAAVFGKLDEEMQELHEAIGNGPSAQNSLAIEHELGDVLFTLCNVARFLKCSAEDSLRRCIGRFEKRFAWVEQSLAKSNKRFQDSDMATLEALWQQAKKVPL